MAIDPRRQLRAWLPHVLVLAAFLAAVWLLGWVAAPLFKPILLAAALAILTGPVLCLPANRLVDRYLPKLKAPLRRRIAGIAATIGLVLVTLTPVVFAVASQADNLSDLWETAAGVATRDPDVIGRVADAVQAQITEINEHYPKLGLPAQEVGDAVRDFLAESTDVNSAFLSFIFAGTNNVAQIVLALISLAYFFIDGPRLVRELLAYSPLTREQQSRLVAQHRRVVLRLLNDTVVTAAVKGVVLGTIVYAVDHTLGTSSLPFAPIAIVAALITLLPLVGVTIVWLPFAGLAWSQENYAGAVVLAVLCWGANFLLERYRSQISNKLQRDSDWLGFLLFVGIIGGLLTSGPRGLIIGPFAVVMVISIGRAWLPLYVDPVHDATPVTDEEVDRAVEAERQADRAAEARARADEAREEAAEDEA